MVSFLNAVLTQKKKMDFSARLPDESKLAYKYFELYRDQTSSCRSLRVLCDVAVDGKNRSLRQIGAWSSQHDWGGRVAKWDAAVERAAAAEIFARRQSEISDFINKDLQMSRDFQALCQARLKKLSEAGNDIDSKELRQLAMAYKDSREWLKELIGLVELQNEMEAKDETAT